MATKQKITTPENAESLKGWLTTTDAAARLKISRQMVNRMVHSGAFKTLTTIGDKPLFIVKEQEIDEMVAARGDRTKEEFPPHS